MSYKIEIEVPEGLEIKEIIFQPKEIVTFSAGRIWFKNDSFDLKEISKYKRGNMFNTWERVIYLLCSKKVVKKSEVVKIASEYGVEDNALEKMVSRIWRYFTEYANQKVGNELFVIDDKTDEMYFGSSFIRQF